MTKALPKSLVLSFPNRVWDERQKVENHEHMVALHYMCSTTSHAFTNRYASRPRWKRAFPITFGAWTKSLPCSTKADKVEGTSMKKNAIKSLCVLALLLTVVIVSACSSNSGNEGTHQMGSAPMSNARMPGKAQ